MTQSLLPRTAFPKIFDFLNLKNGHCGIRFVYLFLEAPWKCVKDLEKNKGKIPRELRSCFCYRC